LKRFDLWREHSRISAENLRLLWERQGGWDEMDIWLDELARAEASGAQEGDELSFPEVLLELATVAEGETPPRTQMRRSLLASYAAYFRRAMERRFATFDVRELLGGRNGAAGERIAYVRNPVTDRVFSCFSRFFRSPTVLYQDTLEDACAQVYAESADFAILPMRGKDGGFARVTLHLLEKYELHAVLGLSLSSEEGEQGQFVLAGRELIPPKEGKDSPTVLSLTLSPQTEEETASLLFAFAAFGCRITALETVHSAYDRVSYRLMLEGEGIRDLLVLLLLDRIGYTVTGLYRLYSTDGSVLH
jgi:hypothetical protein